MPLCGGISLTPALAVPTPAAHRMRLTAAANQLVQEGGNVAAGEVGLSAAYQIVGEGGGGGAWEGPWAGPPPRPAVGVCRQCHLNQAATPAPPMQAILEHLNAGTGLPPQLQNVAGKCRTHLSFTRLCWVCSISAISWHL